MITLAATYNPRGEIRRLQRLFPQFQAVYERIIIAMPPAAQSEDVQAVKALPGVQVLADHEWAGGRYRALKAALETNADYIQYADMDRLIRWAETRPEEWLQIVELVQQCDCLVIGRTKAAWATHPQVMNQVEQIINSVFSFMIGKELDFGAGSKGFSRRAAAFIVANCEPKGAIGSDTEWPILCYRAGFQIDGVLVDGLDWEIPDQYQDRAADAHRQRQMAECYDGDTKHWIHRVGTTVEAIEAGLDAMRRPLVEV